MKDQEQNRSGYPDQYPPMAKRHYLAKCYLNGFATRDQSPAVWQYLKSTSELRKRGVKNVAHRPDYYARDVGDKVDESIEYFFAKIETRWLSVRKHLDSFVYSESIGRGDLILPELTPKDRVDLLSFMFIHTLRVPNAVERARTLVAETLPDGISRRELNNIVLTSMEGFRDRWMRTFLRNNFDKTLCVYVSPAGSRRNFVTTDNPVIYYDGEDGFDESVKLLFPVSKRVLIGFAPMNDSDPVRTKILHDAEHADQVNMIIINNSSDEIYASEPSYLERLLKGRGCSVNRRVATR